MTLRPPSGRVSFAPAGAEPARIAYRHASRLSTLHGETMGTTWSVRLPADAPAVAGLAAALQRTLDDYVAQVSHWLPDSLLSRFNRAAPGSAHVLPAEFAAVVDAAIAIARDTGGAFDPALGALVDLWGFGAGEPIDRPPPADAIDAARPAVGWRRLRFDPDTRTLVQPGGVRLDLSGIAKGHAVDLLGARLAQLGLRDHLVEIGGELRASGSRPGGQPWRVAVQGVGADAPPTGITIALRDRAVATSGDYLRFFDHGGQRYAHTIDPRDGRPVAGNVASVTVVHADCLHADALATALTVMGADEGFAHATRQGLAALFLLRDPIDPLHPRREVIRVKPTPAFIALDSPDRGARS
ncbi:MAG: FAD:protein FMN transferase [Burkholderiaceae bacterium]